MASPKAKVSCVYPGEVPAHKHEETNTNIFTVVFWDTEKWETTYMSTNKRLVIFMQWNIRIEMNLETNPQSLLRE